MLTSTGSSVAGLEDVQKSSAVVAILTHRGLPAEPPPIARARDPAEMTFGFG
jgi:hypothetical protein